MSLTCIIMKRKIFGIFCVIISLFIIYQLPLPDQHVVLYDIPPSYVMAVRGNPIQLYSQVKGVSYNGESNVSLTNISLETSQLFFWNNTQPSNRNLSNNYASVHVWNEICGNDINNLLYYPLFPYLPHQHHDITHLEILQIKKNSGIRIFGFIVPHHSTPYSFHLSAMGVHTEFWLSIDEIPQHASKILKATSHTTENVRVSSQNINLVAEQQYFFDIILKTGNPYGSFKLQWETLKLQKTVIDYNNLQTFSSHHDFSKFLVVDMDYTFPNNTKLLRNKKPLKDLYGTFLHKRTKMFLLPFMEKKDTQDIFSTCEYEPSYVLQFLRHFQGVWETHFTSVYPNDNTDIKYKLKSSDATQNIFGNPLLSRKKAEKVAHEVVLAIEARHGSKYKLVSILNIEENTDPRKGKRYLVELEFSVNNSPKTVRFSQYIYKPRHSNIFCSPKNFQWKKDAEVNVILTVGHQGVWAKYFIDTMTRIYEETKDQNLNVIIVDFDSQDFDIIRALEESPLPRYTLLKRSGNFHKTEAIQAAVNTVTNINAITLQMDLHLTIPSDIIDHVRKHTVQGHMTYSPLVARLQCGANPQVPYGFWEISGYGIFGIYKTDWNIIGGMDVQKYSNKWGSEDWDLLDRVLNAGYEVERLKVKNFYHVYHSKSGMWHKLNAE